MKEIILMRHSFAENASFGVDDFERKLTPKGEKAAKLKGRLLKEIGLIPDEIISSPAKRAFQTAGLVAYEMGFKSVICQEGFLYNDFTTNDFLKTTQQLNNSKSRVLIIGHNPNISNLAFRLGKNVNFGFNPSSFISLAFENDNWNALQPGTGDLTHYQI